MSNTTEAIQEVIVGDERLDSLKSVYSFLETRYKEQIDTLKQVEASVKSRLAMLSAVLAAVAFLTATFWRLPQVVNSPANTLYLSLSILPLFLVFIRVFFLATKSLEQQYATPGFIFEEYIKFSQYPDPCLESVYEDFVKLMSIAIQENTELFQETNIFVITFRKWNRLAVLVSLLPIIIAVFVYFTQ